MSAKRYIPRIENIMLIKIMRPPMLTIAGTLRMKVIIVFFSPLLLLKKKKMRTILKDLMIVVYGPTDVLETELRMTPIIVTNTMTMSNMFQPSMKNLYP